MIDSTLITDPYIFCLDNMLSKEECNDIIKKFEDHIDITSQGVTGSGVDLNVKNSKDLHISQVKGWEKEDELFFNIVNSSMNQYYNYLNSKHNLSYFTTKERLVIHPQRESITDTGY